MTTLTSPITQMLVVNLEISEDGGTTYSKFCALNAEMDFPKKTATDDLYDCDDVSRSQEQTHIIGDNKLVVSGSGVMHQTNYTAHHAFLTEAAEKNCRFTFGAKQYTGVFVCTAFQLTGNMAEKQAIRFTATFTSKNGYTAADTP